ncbi:hypothetical protein HMPREF9141_0074 [Prevotella multiformis DSM 16608]|uniref:Uncharacterized protein n=1 Tax=Prevotella multiformis DSM 16608 TaxID=888743 RepID=F0F3A8_9BACT|nr:hypothetical protein HMPREF9141_0074 [Prevotella multiformis DSM 16608]
MRRHSKDECPLKGKPLPDIRLTTTVQQADSPVPVPTGLSLFREVSAEGSVGLYSTGLFPA